MDNGDDNDDDANNYVETDIVPFDTSSVVTIYSGADNASLDALNIDVTSNDGVPSPWDDVQAKLFESLVPKSVKDVLPQQGDVVHKLLKVDEALAAYGLSRTIAVRLCARPVSSEMSRLCNEYMKSAYKHHDASNTHVLLDLFRVDDK